MLLCVHSELLPNQAVDVDWPSVYTNSELCRFSVEHADELVKRDAAQCHALVVPSQFALSFGGQVSHGRSTGQQEDE